MLALIAILTSNVTLAIAAPPSNDYVLKFEDDFTAKTLDSNKWSTYFEYWNVRTFANNGDQQFWIEKGFNGLSVNPHRMQRGILSLKADLSPDPSKTGGLPYYSGMISTEKSYNATYGYYETRLRVPRGKGLWPAIYLHGDNTQETDILEVLGHETNVIYQFSHLWTGGTLETIFGGPIHKDLIDAADDFHTYGLEWNEEYIAWYVDGKETQRVKNYAFEPRYYISVFAVGGYWPGSPGSSTHFPSSVDIDYVRIYSKD